ncbi:GNAT family N-acetyltransferase [Phyllobacterium phragmitis]|uniref:GNAT family N-acetyltransferase n=1 Tax=Phyllobacterium phragmitis TaxID=2670329 RepID=A0A2S9IX99_9HYPH|nr:GNAT family N-acetyltransferase [Phyllobacterium phragmitis]PRD45151.1 GNAT family N-acetyltransferase [Phyllobacterium phragmitis]
MIITETERLIIRNWQEHDRALFHEINSDPEVMEYFGFLRDREQSDELLDRLKMDIDATGYGFYALEERATRACLGFAGLALTDLEPHFPKGTVEIGWRLAKRHWGKGYVTEAGRQLLAHGFDERGLDEIVSFAVFNNHRSTAVMQRLGMKRDPARDFDHPKVSDATPHLKPHVVYSIARQDRLGIKT